MAARDFAADDRGGNHLALAVFNQHDSHALADVVAGHIAENARAFGVERKVDRGLLGLRIASRLSVLEIFAGKNDLAEQEQRPAIAVGIAFQAERDRKSSVSGKKVAVS